MEWLIYISTFGSPTFCLGWLLCSTLLPFVDKKGGVKRQGPTMGSLVSVNTTKGAKAEQPLTITNKRNKRVKRGSRVTLKRDLHICKR